MPAQVDVEAVQQRLVALKPPTSGPPDPVTKLWGRHLSHEVLAQQAGGGKPALAPAGDPQPGDDRLRRRFPEYFQQYGY